MKSDERSDAASVFPKTVTRAVSELKKRLQREYERTYPELGDLVRIVLDEAEAKAWELSFPHLFLPDLVEADVAQLGLQPVATRRDKAFAPAGFTEIENHQPLPALCG